MDIAKRKSEITAEFNSLKAMEEEMQNKIREVKTKQIQLQGAFAELEKIEKEETES